MVKKSNICYFLQILSIRSSLPHLRAIVLYGDDDVPSEVEFIITITITTTFYFMTKCFQRKIPVL